jgi:hypothetical protein
MEQRLYLRRTLRTSGLNAGTELTIDNDQGIKAEEEYIKCLSYSHRAICLLTVPDEVASAL